jgi:2-keto-3-deoxy-L-rhamnonate aldolase RhmA
MWSVVPSATVVEIAAASGLDFVILDMEHGPWDLVGVQDAARACELRGCAPLVRVPSADAKLVQSVLDTGVHGVIVPQVEGVQDVESALLASTLAPRGLRGSNPFTRAAGFDPAADGAGDRLEHGFLLRGVIIETSAAWAELDGILALDDLDVVYLGVYDMSLASGWSTTDPARSEFLEAGVSRCRAAGKAAGVMVRSPEDVRWALGLGATFCVYSVDSSVFHTAISEMKMVFSNAVGGMR